MHASTTLPGDRPLAAALLPFALLGILWAALLGGSMLLGNVAIGSVGGSHGSPAATWLRMGSSAALIVVGALAWARFRGTPAGRFAFWIALGMALGTVGDLFNAGLLEFIPLPDPVLGGIAAFGLGHVAYITGCIGLARAARLTDRRALAAAIVAWQLFGLAGWCVVAMQGSEARDLVWPASPTRCCWPARPASPVAWPCRTAGC